MAYTQAQIDQFEQTLVDRNGAITATFSDQSVSFTSYADAMAFLASMKRQATGGGITRYAATDKDL
jgi:hypothetical protein